MPCRKPSTRARCVEEEAAYRTRAKQKDLELYASIDPKKVLALALAEIGQNAGQIGNLTITSEILAAILDGRAELPVLEPGLSRSWRELAGLSSSRARQGSKN